MSRIITVTRLKEIRKGWSYRAHYFRLVLNDRLIGRMKDGETIAFRISEEEQLLEIYRFDQEKYDGLSDLITVSPEHITPYPLWSYPADSLRMHPYISNLETAKAIVLYRQNTPREEWTVDGLRDAGILTSENANKLSKCLFD